MVYYLYICSIDHGVLLVYIMVYYLYICSIDISIYHGVLSIHLINRY